jgi:hypothetical protein
MGVSFCGLELAHPVINGSGTFDAIAARRAFGDALMERFPFAAFVSKTVTLAPRQGNPPPRLWELPAGLMNSIGLPNKGLAGYLEHDLPELAALPVPLIVNVMGFTRDEVARLVEAFAERSEVAALELNVSCPNVETGLIMGADRPRPRGSSSACARSPASRSSSSSRRTPPTPARWPRRPSARAPTPSRSSTPSRAWRCTRARASRGSVDVPGASPDPQSGPSPWPRFPTWPRGSPSRW